MNKNYYAILMAGGVGSRFWPVSTPDFPKQFHDMLGTGETLLQKTYERLKNIIPSENIYILTNERYDQLVSQQLPEIKKNQIVLEPAMRNTGPCILYASQKINQINPNALMLVAPSDHWIEDESSFVSDVQRSFDFCEQNDALMTLGIQPTFPNTGFGYIESENSHNPINKVVQFREKPNYQTAKTFLEKGNFLWNAGIFIWTTKSILKAFKNHEPNLYELFNKGITIFNTKDEKDFIKNNYHLSESISIDYAVMEKASNVFTTKATFDWNDLGTWGSLYNKLEKDSELNAIVNSDLLAKDASRNLIRSNSPNKLVVIDGLNDYIVVDHDEVLLIYPKSKEQDIKTIVNEVKLKYEKSLTPN